MSILRKGEDSEEIIGVWGMSEGEDLDEKQKENYMASCHFLIQSQIKGQNITAVHHSLKVLYTSVDLNDLQRPAD